MLSIAFIVSHSLPCIHWYNVAIGNAVAYPFAYHEQLPAAATPASILEIMAIIETIEVHVDIHASAATDTSFNLGASDTQGSNFASTATAAYVQGLSSLLSVGIPQ